MKKEFNVIIEKDSAGYLVASVPQLPGCHTQAKTLESFLIRIKEAMELCVEEYGIVSEPNDFMSIQKVCIEA